MVSDRPGSGFAVLSVLLLLGACGGGAPPAPPAPEVGVFVAEPRAVTTYVEVPGRVQAVRTAQVRARVDGIVQRRVYDEGSDVSAGQTLFLIDPREARAELGVAQASLKRAEAMAANARQDVERYSGLVEDQAISKQEYDAAVARLRTAEADVAQMRAQVDRASLTLGYTTVTAPIAGRASRAQVTEGALVSASSATLLTTIEDLDPVYVNFSRSGSELLRMRGELRSGARELPELDKVDVTLVLDNGSKYAHTGHIDFLDLAIDEATGTAAVRAVVPNPERALLPGQFVRARIASGVLPQAFLVPQAAVQVSDQGASVLLVGRNNLVEVRPITLGDLQGDSWVVKGGLQGGDRVIVNGLQMIRPGMPVRIAGAAATPAATKPAGAPQSGR